MISKGIDMIEERDDPQIDDAMKRDLDEAEIYIKQTK